MLGAKQWETRSWRTHYTGWIAIHAAIGFPKWAKELVGEEPFSNFLTGLELPRGMLLGVVQLWGCKRSEDAIGSASRTEQAFGDWSPGRWVWGLQYPSRLRRPIQAKGSLGLWNLAPEQETVFRQAARI